MNADARPLRLSALHGREGATFTGVWGLSLPSSFGDPGREYAYADVAVGLVDQSYRGVVDLSGEGCEELLERIVSSHPEDLDDRNGQPACLLTAKGRLAGAFHLFRAGEDRFRAVSFEPPREALLEEFRKYALLSDVDVADRTGSVSILSVQGPRAGKFLASLPGITELPREELRRCSARIAGREVTVVRAGETLAGGFEIWVSGDDLPEVWTWVLDSAREFGGGAVGWSALESLRLEAGFPRYGMDYSEESFPAEIGWERALSYDKCYVGQEVVARMRTYGQVNRKLFQLFPEGEEVPSPGSRILSGDAEAGSVTSAAYSYRYRRPLALGRIKRRYWSEGGLTLEHGGRRLGLELKELPLVGRPDAAGEGGQPEAGGTVRGDDARRKS